MPAYADTRLAASGSWPRPRSSGRGTAPPTSGRIRPGGRASTRLGFSTSYTVDAAVFAELKRGSERLGLTAERARHRAAFFSAKEAPDDEDDTLTFLGSQFRKGDGFHVATKVNREDADAILRQIKEARRQADWVIFSFHSHEFGGGGRLTAATDVGMEEMAEFYVDVRARRDRRGRRRGGRPRPASHARRRDLSRPADPLQPRQLHLPERHRRGVSGGGLSAFRPAARGDAGRFPRYAHRRRPPRLSRLARILGRACGRMRVPRSALAARAASSARPRPWPPARATRPAAACPRRRRAAHPRAGGSTFTALRDQNRRSKNDVATVRLE